MGAADRIFACGVADAPPPLQLDCPFFTRLCVSLLYPMGHDAAGTAIFNAVGTRAGLGGGRRMGSWRARDPGMGAMACARDSALFLGLRDVFVFYRDGC